MAGSEVKIKITADGAQASRAIAGVTGKLNALAKDGAALAAASFAGIVTTATAAFVALDRLAKQAGDFQDLAERTGSTAEAMASLSVAASIGGTNMEEVGQFAVRLTKNLTGVDDESKAAGAAITALGLDLKDLKSLDPADQMERIARALAGFEDGTKKTAIMEALAKGSSRLLPYMKELSAQDGRRVILTQQMIEQADEYSDRQAKSRAQLNLYAQAMVTQALPALTAFQGALSDTAKEILGVDEQTGKLSGTGDKVKQFAEGASVSLATVADLAWRVGQSFRWLGDALGATAAQAAAIARGDFAGARLIGELAQQNRAAINFDLGLADKVAARFDAIRKDAARQPFADPRSLGNPGSIADQAKAIGGGKKKLAFDGAIKDEKAGKGEKEKLSDQQTGLAAYVKKLSEAREKVLDLNEEQQALNFLLSLGPAGQIPQVRELVLNLAREIDATKALEAAEKSRAEAAQGAAKLADQSVSQRAQELDTLAESNQSLREEIALIGLDEKARRAAILTKQDQAVSDAELALIQARSIEGNEIAISQMERELNLLRQRRELTANKSELQQAADAATEQAKMSDSLSASISEGLLKGFRNGKTLADVFLEELKAQFGKTILQPVIKPIAEAGSNLISTGLNAIFGSLLPGHAAGLDYVPYDNYVARLHKGERVMTAAENKAGTAGHTYNITMAPNIGNIATKDEVIMGMRTAVNETLAKLAQSQRRGGAFV